MSAHRSLRPWLVFVVWVIACRGPARLEARPTTPPRSPAAQAPCTDCVIHAGVLIDGRSAKPRRNVSILVRGGRIVTVKSGFVAPSKRQRRIDLREYTVLPGLIDMHTHLSGQLSGKSYTERFFLAPADYALRGALYARRTLMAGFTTVRDLGDRHNVTVSLRNAITEGWIVGPRIFTATKSIATTGGHADPTNGLRRGLQGDPGPRDGVINGPDDARKAVRQRYKDGADLIKLTATGGVLSLAKSGQNPQFTAEELVAVVTAARDYGFSVAVHAHGAEGMKRAIRAGVHSIEHGTFMNDEIIQLMKKHGTYYVPTISAGKWVAAKAKEEGFFPAVVRPKAAAIGPRIAATFAKAHAAGVLIAFGTDSGVSPHGDNAREFIYMVEGGMTPMAAIQSATLTAARLLGAEDRLGSVEQGKVADLIAVKADPLRNIAALLDVSFVMKEGVIHKAL